MGSNFPCHHKEREIVQRETARKTKDHFSSASSIENKINTAGKQALLQQVARPGPRDKILLSVTNYNHAEGNSVSRISYIHENDVFIL